MIENLLNKRYVFVGQIHTPRSGDISILSIDPKGFAYFTFKRIITNMKYRPHARI